MFILKHQAAPQSNSPFGYTNTMNKPLLINSGTAILYTSISSIFLDAGEAVHTPYLIKQGKYCDIHKTHNTL